MNKITLVILSFLFLTSLNGIAQENSALAEEIIRKSVEKYKSYNSIKVKFKYIIENRMAETNDELSGVFYLKDGNFRLTIGEQIIISNQKKVWTYLKDVNEVQVNNYNPEELEINPKELFTIWEKGFLYGYGGEARRNNKNINLIILTPENKSKSFFKVKIFIEKETSNILKMQTFYKDNGLILTFDILSIETNIKLNDSFFEFDISKHKGIEVVDLTE